MVNHLKGWIKIYLFYGVVFFLLGLFGSLASDQTRIQAWSTRQKENLVRIWADITQTNESEPALPAFTNHSGKIILQVYEPDNLGNATPFKSFVQELQGQLKNHFPQVMLIWVESLDTGTWELSGLNGSSILIGFKKTPEISEKKGGIRNQFFFSMPENDSSLLAGKLTQALAGRLSTFFLRKETGVRNTLYEFMWDEKQGNQNNRESEVFSTFMQIMNEDIIPTMGKPNFE